MRATELPRDKAPEAKGGKRQAEIFSLKTPALSEGRLGNFLVTTDLMRVGVKVYASGGENTMHSHPYEDHAFIVTAGQATFHLETDDNVRVVNRNEGIMLPQGARYWFRSTAAENLVMIRIGAGEKPKNWRVHPDGTPFETDTAENRKANKHVAAVPIQGKFHFGD